MTRCSPGPCSPWPVSRPSAVRPSTGTGTGTSRSTTWCAATTALGAKLINDATTGLTNVARSVAYTDGTPTTRRLCPKILNGQANLEAVMLDQDIGNVCAVMHSRRWAWMQSQVGTSWPFIGQPGYPVRRRTELRHRLQPGRPRHPAQRRRRHRGQQHRHEPGRGTNEDEIYIVSASELPPVGTRTRRHAIRTEATAATSLGVLMVVYGYAAYSFRRYTNGLKIAGTGLVTPTF